MYLCDFNPPDVRDKKPLVYLNLCYLNLLLSFRQSMLSLTMMRLLR